jgi:mRNA-degrading endonuclease RelE of RelBE toxin-antitoxin system
VSQTGRRRGWGQIAPCQAARRGAILQGMFQVVFNGISAGEMAALPKDLQLDLLAEFQFLPGDLDSLDGEKFGKVSRDGRSLLRYRAKDYRIYFERNGEGVLVHRVLHKNTIRDFLFRSNLPMDDEDGSVAKAGDFWKLIREAEEAR